MDASQMMENLQALLLQTEKRQDEKRRQEAEEAEKRQDEKRRQEREEAEERQKALMLETEERQKDKTEALFETMQKQLQEHTTAELGLLRGDVGELRGELNNQITRISDVEESMSNKIAKVEKSVLTVEEVMSTKISAVENSMANIREQIKIEVEQCMKIQPKQISEQTVPCLLYTSRCV